jgi:predicted dehydrogenase
MSSRAAAPRGAQIEPDGELGAERDGEPDGDLGMAIVGCGGAGADVAHAIGQVPGLVLVATHDRDEALARDLAAGAGATVHPTLTSLLADERVDIVYIALPHDLLATVARAALMAGRHALVEKPMATTTSDIDALATLADDVGRTLGVFYEMRFTPAALAARELVAEGAIGAIVGVHIRTMIDKSPAYWRFGYTGRTESTWRGDKARAGGGVVLMNTSHQLDIVAMVTNLDVISVAGHIAIRTAGIDVEDEAAVVLRFSNGALGTLVAGAHVAGADGETIELIGERGRLLLDPYAGRLIHVARGEPARVVVEARPKSADRATFVAALSSFAAAARESRPAPVGGPAARRVLATIEAIYGSSARGGAPIRIPDPHQGGVAR